MPGQTDTQPTLGAVILAGGLARRMGGNDKGLIELHGRPMVSWAIDAIKPVADEMVINANRNQEAYGRFDSVVIGDTIAEFPGPLAGLLSACEHLTTDWVFMCPCDSPFVKSELVNTLWQTALVSEKSIVVAHDGERLQPVFAIINRHLKQSLKTFLTRGERKIDLWYEEEGYEAVDCAEYRAMFDNINTAEQLDMAEKNRLN